MLKINNLSYYSVSEHRVSWSYCTDTFTVQISSLIITVNVGVNMYKYYEKSNNLRHQHSDVHIAATATDVREYGKVTRSA